MKTIHHTHELVVVGGGLAGLCAAVTAARQGVRTALIHDRPVLGGNASIEIRVPPVGATQCNFAYSRETGLIEELFLNNLHHNPTWCPEGWNLELENLVRNEPDLDLFLNNAVCEVAMHAGKDRVESVKAYCSMEETWHVFEARYFADCSGDGVVGSLSGATFRMGVEARSEFDEPMCPDEPTGDTMGMSLHLHARDAGRPMPFTRPKWVDLELSLDDFGPYRPVCEHFFPDTGGFWWLEWGGALDTVHDTTKIKEEVQRITLAVWDFLKNRSSLAGRLETYELDWLGAVPGKRESRRFEGDHILTMNEIDEQAVFEDALAYGGWGFDHHPPHGFHDKVNPSTHQYLRGPHNVPLRSLYSKNIRNLFFAGRNISATHYALSSTRVMLTCAQLGEAAGMAASHAARLQRDPGLLVTGKAVRDIQRDLFLADHHIHALEAVVDGDIAPEAAVSASSVFSESDPMESWGVDPLRDDRMLQVPVTSERLDSISLLVDAACATQLHYRFHQGPANHSTFPEDLLTEGTLEIPAGASQWIDVPLDCIIQRPGWHFLILGKNPDLAVHMTETPPGKRWNYPRPEDPIRPNYFTKWTSRSLMIGMTRAVDADGAGVVAPDWNDYARDFKAESLFLNFAHCCRTTPAQDLYGPEMTVNGHNRPTHVPNLWVSAASLLAEPEWIALDWESPRNIAEVQLLFDSSLHFHFWQSWQGYPRRSIPSIVRDYRIIAEHRDGTTTVIAEVTGNYQRNRRHRVSVAGVSRLRVEILATNGITRAQIYGIRVIREASESVPLPQPESRSRSRISRLLGVALGALLAFAPLAANADILYGLTNDTEIREDGNVLATNATALLIGGSGNPALDRSGVYVFQLPNLGAVANPFTNSKFQFHVSSKSGTAPSVDLYGIGRRSSANVLATDYYGETSTSDPTDATLILSNILTSSVATGVRSTSSTALRNYLNAQYASGAGAGQYVFLRFSTKVAASGSNRFGITSADGGVEGGATDTRPQIVYNIPSGFTRPFIWVRDSEKAAINAKIASNPWATSVFNGMVSRAATNLASHQANRDTFLRELPIVSWTVTTPKFKTIPAYAESDVRWPTLGKFNNALDCAVLFYLTGDANYARCAGDILHNSVKTLLPVAASTSTGNGGWIFQTDLLKEARVTGTQLPIVYDFLYSWLQNNQVYDVKTASMVNFNFTTAQSVFRKYYQLTRDHGQKDSNWSALMSTTMLNNLLALDDSAERSTALQVYLTTGTSRQASLEYDYRYYTEAGDIWPESLQYAGAVGIIRSNHMVLLERVDPNLNLFDTYPNLPLSLPRISYMRYPNGQQITFGDGHRDAAGQPYSHYELVYQHAIARGKTSLATFFGSLVNGGITAGEYDRSALRAYNSLGMQNEPQQLLWQAAMIDAPSVTPELPRTDTLPFAGISLQRNPSPTNNPDYGFMASVGGSNHVHSHACGMNMEIYGLGEVMGAKSGRTDYGTADHEKYYRLFASNNTVIVNGASRGEGGWASIAINKVQSVAMEPQPFASAVSPNFSFTTSSFGDNRGDLAEATQQRTMAIVRTSPTSGFYVDVFRSKSTVTNRTATTLNGPVTDQYHDYIYRNFGETSVDLRADGVTLPLTSQSNRFQNDIGDAYDQPGWRYFTNTSVSYPTSQSMRARFNATLSGVSHYMSMHMPAVASREYAKVNSPKIVDAPSPYDTRVAPTLVVRQIGEAWDKAFATVYEPHFGINSGTVQNVTQLVRSGIVVGVKVESTLDFKNTVHYIISNPGTGQTYTDSAAGLSFTGRFGIAVDNGDDTTTLYLGEGSSMSYRGNSVTTVSGASSQAEVLFSPGQAPVVTANTAVNAVAAPPKPGFTWVPSTAGTFDWNSTANWNPATIPNVVGAVAYKNINLTVNQTVNLSSPVTLGEIVVGDNSGSETTLLQKTDSGSINFDQIESGSAYLTRTAGGTGTVTLSSDLGISLTDNLTVRSAGGSANSTIVIAGTISGAGKSLTKQNDNLTLLLTGANTYSGVTRISSGILSLNQSLAIQNSPLDTSSSILGNATNGLRTTVTTLTLGGLTGSSNLASLFTTSTGGYSGVTALTLNPGSGNTHTYSGVIANGAAGMALTKTGSGTQVLNGVNTFTGATSLAANSGTLRIGAAGSLGSGSYTGAITIGSGSVLEYNSSAAQILSGTISGSGDLVKNTGSNTLAISGSNTSFTGPVTINSGILSLGNTNALSAATSLSLAGTSALYCSAQNATINAPISVSGTPQIHAPDFGTGSTTSTLTLGGVISGTADVTFSSLSAVASNSNQTILLNAQSNYTGVTILHPGDTDANLIVKIGINNALPTSTVLAINGSSGAGSGRSTKFDLSGFSQTIAGLQNTPAGTLRFQQVRNTPATAVTLTINGTTNHSFSGSINDNNISLNKAGTGTQTLAGINTMNGNTTVSGGNLLGVVGGSSASSPVILNNSSATFGVSITDNTKTWTCPSLTTSAAGHLEFNFGAVSPGTTTPMTVTGLAAFSSTPLVRVVTSVGLAPGTYPLMSWGSTSGTAPSVVSVVNPAGTGGLSDGTFASLTLSGNTLSLVITGVPSTVKANNTNNLNLGGSWVGGVAPNSSSTATWNNTVTAANTTVLGANTTWAGITVFNPGGTVTINAGHTLTLGANENDINMSSATANLALNCPLILGDAHTWNVASGRTLTINGIVSGSFPITKSGLGTAILTGLNLFDGGTTLSDSSGILEIGGAGTLGGGTHPGTIDIGSGSTFRYNSSAAQNLSGAISGAGTLAKNASSTLTLGSENTGFIGTIQINAGTLNLGNTAALGAATSLSIAGAATLSTQTTGITCNVPITLGATGTTSTIAFGRNTSAQGSFALNSAISGSADLRLTTPSSNSGGNLQTIFLGSINSYAGNTLITTGNSGNTLSVRATAADALPSSTILTIDGGNGSGSGRTVTFDLNGHDQSIAGLTNTTGRTARNQRITNNSSDIATLTITNATDFTYGGVGPSSTFNGNTVIPSAQIAGNLELNKAGPGKLTLAAGAGNTFSGPTAVLEGILFIGHPTSLQNSPLDLLNAVSGDATNGLQTNLSILTLGGLVGEKNLASVFSTTSGGYSAITALTLNPVIGATYEYSGIIAKGAAGMTLTKTGLGTQILAATNTYTGATFINAGTLALGANDVLPSTSVSIGDATLDIANFTDTVGTLDLTGPATIHLDADGNIAFANSSAIDWTNDIVGGGTLNITGTFVSGSSLRFGNTNAGLTPQQLALITAEGLGPVTLNAAGYLTASAISSYATWAVTNAPITGSNPNADEDGDGVPNGVEYVLGGTIGTNDQANLPVLSTSGGNLVFTFQRDQASIDGTTILAIEVGTDLATWTIPPSPYAVPIAATGPVNPGVSAVKDSPEPGIDTVTLTLPQTPDSKKFVRLRVTP